MVLSNVIVEVTIQVSHGISTHDVLGTSSGRSKIIYFKRLDHASYSILLFYMADPTIIKDESHHFF